MQWTPDQQAASAAFSHFMITPDSEMVLSGGAGTGKTTLLRHWMTMKEPGLMRSLAGQPPIKTWHLTATTNKAAEVLANATGQETSTVHSLFALKVYNDFDTGQVKLVKTPNFKLIENSLIVIDESSMIDRRLHKLIQESVVNCKILYVGDHCQLAPIGETTSSVFASPNKVFLNTIVRSQHAPAITALTLQLRQTVEDGLFRPIQEVPGVIDYLSPDQAEAEIDRHFVQNASHQAGVSSRILAYSNRKVIRFNDYIRTRRGLPRELVAGDWVVSNSVVGNGKHRTRVEQELLILKIEDERDFQVYARNNAVHTVKVRDVVTSAGTFPVPSDRAHWEAMIKYFAAEKDWRPHYTLKEEIADFRPRDACTVHKSQGSTYETVFVDLSDIGECRKPAEVARLLHVACSRPTTRICFFGRLPPKYAG